LVPAPPNTHLTNPIVKNALADYEFIPEDDLQQETLVPDEDTLVDSGLFDYPSAPIDNSARSMPPDSETDIQCPFGYHRVFQE
jgi:hypothetical protein